MIDFIVRDISTFGIAVFCLIVAVMWLFFRRLRWVMLPLLSCAITICMVVGLLSWLDWRATVISSNFISILIIITISLTIHLVVRYEELSAANPDGGQASLVRKTVQLMFQPCLFTAITTIVAFASLVVSGIRPVIDFGWIMTLGIALAFVVSFILFPSSLAQMRHTTAVLGRDVTHRLTNAIALFALGHRNKILTLFAALTLLSLLGILQLRVDNRFIDYFKQSTEIYQGMRVIDTQLGGTNPLAIIIDADPKFFEYLKKLKAEEELFKDPFKQAGEDDDTYWFHPDRLLEVEKIHDYLESLPQIGKVLSLGTTLKVVRFLNNDQVPDDYDLAIYRKIVPPDVRQEFLDPYLSKDGNQVRITMRIEESDPALKRGKLFEKIKRFLVNEMNIAEDRIHFTDMAVLYNNMLQSLYRSQILTLGMVFMAILGMFVILFRNLYLAFLATIPNIFSALTILGLMGWSDIPLDMMTITIAAITIGIGVDDTIHYIHRFRHEFAINPHYRQTVLRCHGSIGRAIYYTSITITVGFSILTLSNFMPTVYFGLLTGIAMILALIGDLILLPLLLMIGKPLGPEPQRAASLGSP
jgi:predicted RND superfamily exporter protein